MAMHLLCAIKPEDVDSSASTDDYSTYKPRPAVRAVVFDGTKVALIFIRKHGYYMLPGGGIDEIEDPVAALHRELYEELGCKVQIIGEVGSITIYNSRWHSKQTDHCYTATLLKRNRAATPTAFETEEEHEVIWSSSIANAIQRIQDARPSNVDGKLVRARDLLFLETVQRTHTT